MSPPRVRLLGRTDCHLCELARERVARVCADTGETWEEQDVDTDPDLLARYGDWVPVVFVDGAELDVLHVSEARLRAALTG